MSTLELCEKYFQTRDIYKLFESEKTATASDLKKTYYKLSLQVHPDRVDESEKEIATEKFKILSKLYQTLTDKEKRALYDDQGIIDDDDEGDLDSKLTSWLEMWKNVFNQSLRRILLITNKVKEILNWNIQTIISYLNSKGCLNKMLNEVPFLKVEDQPRVQENVKAKIDAGEVPKYKIFTNEPAQKRKRCHQKNARESERVEEKKKKNNKNKEMGLLNEVPFLKVKDEPRVKEIVEAMIAAEEVPEYKIFTNEPAQKRKRCHQKYARESERVEEKKKKNNKNIEMGLEQEIKAKQKSGDGDLDTFMARLLAEYGCEDVEDGIELEDLGKKSKEKANNAGGKKSTPPKNNIHAVKNGKVNKRKN